MKLPERMVDLCSRVRVFSARSAHRSSRDVTRPSSRPLRSPDASDRPGLHVVMTVSHGFETYLAGQPRRLAEQFDVTLVASPGPGLVAAADAEGVRSHALLMERKISPLRDLRALAQLYRVLRTDRH